MPWKAATKMSLRKEFIELVHSQTVTMQSACQRFDISRKTGYKWIHRVGRGTTDALEDQSRRPHHSPFKTPRGIEEAILRLRDQHGSWGGRKLRHRLTQLGHTNLPSASTITAILQRHGRIDPHEAIKHQPWQRFEAAEPNALWQMDFKGHFPVLSGRCHPLTVLDDHSRYNIGLMACRDETRHTVQAQLTTLFRIYGLPRRILADNGSPWGGLGREAHTRLAVWLMQLGVNLVHARVLHPQTLGKDERFHRTMKLELLPHCIDQPFAHCQRQFELWRTVYNTERPHESLNMDVPAEHYRGSDRPFPEQLPSVHYDHCDEIRKVQSNGEIYFRGRIYFIGYAFHRFAVALRPTLVDGLFDVFFSTFKITQINLNDNIES